MSTPTDVLLVFQVDQHATTVRTKLQDMGYQVAYKAGIETFELPSQAVWKANTTADQAIEDLRVTCDWNSANLQGSLAINCNIGEVPMYPPAP